jgi:muscarinic acetylcholine receptor
VYWRIWKEASKHAKQMRTSGLHESASDWKSVQVSLEFFVRICIAFCVHCPLFSVISLARAKKQLIVSVEFVFFF